ncbi:MAG: apolipoprotein N-acyltransferase, partial [Rhodobacteraceae bacterium]|nr:apolipoprotein N-acyltransferase [Paracoccaceae bacterium]
MAAAAGPGARRPRLAVLALAAGAGALVAAGQAPLGAWYVALPALAVVMALIARQGGVRAAAWCGWMAGAGHFAAALHWIVEPFLVDPVRHGWMAPFALVLMAFGMALFWAAAAAGAAWLGGRARWRRALALAVTLALSDLARGYVLTGFPWASIGHVWIGTPAMQLAAFVGPVGLGLLATGLAALPVLVAGRAGLARGGAAALAGLALAMAAGAWREGAAMPAPPSGQVVRLVQPNATQRLKWDRAMIPVFYQRQLLYTAAGARPDLVIWPETALPWLLEDAGPALAEIAAAARGAPVALGIQRREGRRILNSLVAIDAAGLPFALYDKHHLVPFGEYIPGGDFAARFGLRGFAAQEGAAYTA